MFILLRKNLVLLFSFAFIMFFANEAYSRFMPAENPMPDELDVPAELLNIEIPDKLPSVNYNVDMPKLSEFKGETDFLLSVAANPAPLRYVPKSYDFLKDPLFMWPVIGKVSSNYGFRFNRIHEGIDIPMPKGTPILASRSGVVKRADSVLRGYGRLVIVDHGNGVETRYAHCSSFAVNKGDSVNAGQIIAYVGNSGRSTADHLHFEIVINGLAYNPMRFLSEYPLAAAAKSAGKTLASLIDSE